LSYKSSERNLSTRPTGDIHSFCRTHIDEVETLIKTRIEYLTFGRWNLTEEQKEDFLHDGLIFLFERLDQYQPQLGAVSNFICSLMHHFILNKVRSLSRAKKNLQKFKRLADLREVQPYADEPFYFDLPEFHGIEKDISQHLMLGKTQKDIATLIGVDKSTVNSSVRRIKNLIEEKRKCCQ
jgi:DNA-directed RNA polymerase specialized sigma24 family protein